MSREERRAYKRLMKNRDPYALPETPAVKARRAQQRARQERSAATSAASPGLSGRFLWWAIGGGLLAGLGGLSLAWPAMPQAALVGLGALVGWIVLLFGLRALTRRQPPPSSRR